MVAQRDPPRLRPAERQGAGTHGRRALRRREPRRRIARLVRRRSEPHPGAAASNRNRGGVDARRDCPAPATLDFATACPSPRPSPRRRGGGGSGGKLGPPPPLGGGGGGRPSAGGGGGGGPVKF